MKNFALLFAIILALAVQAFADSTVDYISLNGPGGSFTTTWDGQPGTNIGGATNLFGSAPGWDFDIYANNNAGVFSNFVGGGFPS